MAHVVVLGAGLGGTILASELREKLGRQHSISVVTKGSSFRFVPSNPWVAVGWRRQADVEVDLTRIFAQTGIGTVEEAYGRSCGGRIGTGVADRDPATTPCVAIFGAVAEFG